MGRKGDRTKSNIAAAARKVFAQKGFARTTMQDICNASGMSRGGLYRHFDSTSAVFIYIINEDQEKALASLKLAIKTRVPAHKIFDKFLRARISQVLDEQSSIDNAVSEFVSCDPEGAAFLAGNINKSVKILADIIRICRSERLFSCNDPEGMARHIFWVIEGMSRHNALIKITDAEIEKQISLIYEALKFSGR